MWVYECVCVLGSGPFAHFSTLMYLILFVLWHDKVIVMDRARIYSLNTFFAGYVCFSCRRLLHLCMCLCVCAFFSHYFSLYCCFLFIIIAWWYSFFDKSYSMSSVRSMVTYFCSHLSPLFFGEKISYFLPAFTPTDVHINRNICVPSPHTLTHPPYAIIILSIVFLSVCVSLHPSKNEFKKKRFVCDK